MRIFHSSDWHIGRSFHAHPTIDALRAVLDALVTEVRDRNVDVVIVAGDVFDSATPSADAFTLLEDTLVKLHEAGAAVVLTSGNHDSVARLGFQSTFARLAGIHVLTDSSSFDVPVTIGGVDFFGIPYLEPSIMRGRYPEAELRSQAQTVGWAMDRIRAARTDRPAVVVSHCFTAGVTPTESLEREITAGGIDVVPLTAFDGVDYVALGHIHGQQTLRETVRYSGAPLHYSFKEAHKKRGGWVVDIQDQVTNVEWVDLPIPRPLVVLEAKLDDLLSDRTYAQHEDSWVSAVLTDDLRPVDAMLKLKQRYPHCANVEYRPANSSDSEDIAYGDRIRAKSDSEIIDAFLAHVRDGHGPTDAEAAIIQDVLDEATVEEAAA